LTVTDPCAGEVWRYPFLWDRQSKFGETEGRKERPTAIVAAVHDAKGSLFLALLPITTQQPGTGRISLPIPQMEARRIGLTTAQPLWVIIDEYNHDNLSRSYYFDQEGRIGAMSAAFLKQVSVAFVTALQQRRTARVRRDI
jgi:hypothetical protein